MKQKYKTNSCFAEKGAAVASAHTRSSQKTSPGNQYSTRFETLNPNFEQKS